MKNSQLLAMAMASLVLVPAWAEEAEAEAPKAEKKTTISKATFSALPFCKLAEGEAEVLKPRGEWESVQEGKFYPLGSAFRVGKDGVLQLCLGEDSFATIKAGSSFATLEQAYGELTRGLILQSGTLDLDLADNLPEGAIAIAAQGLVVKNPAGESRYVKEATPDGEKVTVRCVTGTLAVEGRHFVIPQMRAADEVVIRSSHDFLCTQLLGTSGDYVVRLDQGVRFKDSIDDNGNRTTVAEPATTEWHLSPATRVLINRSVPAIGSRMSVVTMAFDAAGERKSECNFCEGRAEINSGELVVKEKTDGEELAKRAAEATETTESTDEEESSESSDNESENNKTEKSEEE